MSEMDRIARLEFQVTELSAKNMAMARGIADVTQKQSIIVSDIATGVSFCIAAILHEFIRRGVIDDTSAIGTIDAAGAELSTRDHDRIAQIVPDQIILELRRLREQGGH